MMCWDTLQWLLTLQVLQAMKAEERASLGAIQLRRKARGFANKRVKV